MFITSFFVIFYNVYKAKIFIVKSEIGRKAPRKPSSNKNVIKENFISLRLPACIWDLIFLARSSNILVKIIKFAEVQIQPSKSSFFRPSLNSHALWVTLNDIFLRYSHMEIVNLLLEQPTTVVDRIGADQMTPFHYGCRYLVYIMGAGIWFILWVQVSGLYYLCMYLVYIYGAGICFIL